MNDSVVRFSVAIGGELLRQFDRYREDRQYPNRSEAVRGLMRDALAAETLTDDDAATMGVLTLIYDHHRSGLAERLTELQHQHLDQVISSTHVHLDAHRCLEVILLRGTTREVSGLADGLIASKGVETGKLVLAPARTPEEIRH